MSKTRENGFYWCETFYQGWYPCEWKDDHWEFPGTSSIIRDEMFLQIDERRIDERRIVREEPIITLPDTCKYCGLPLPNDADERYYHQNNECPVSGNTERIPQNE